MEELLPLKLGLLKEIIKEYAPTKSILGVCLGQQAIGEVFGATLTNLEKVYHGVATPVQIIAEDVMFDGISNPMIVGRYHSWVVEGALPDSIEILAEDENGQVMAIRHKTFNVRGVQFHPESVLTPQGKKLLKNWLRA